MFAFVLIAIVLTVAVVARLVPVVPIDRPLSPPRSHTHDLDPRPAQMHRVF